MTSSAGGAQDRGSDPTASGWAASDDAQAQREEVAGAGAGIQSRLQIDSVDALQGERPELCEAFRRDKLRHEAPQLDLIIGAALPYPARLELANDGPLIGVGFRKPQSGQVKPYQVVLITDRWAFGPQYARTGEGLDSRSAEGTRPTWAARSGGLLGS